MFTISINRSELARNTRKPRMKSDPVDQNVSNTLFFIINYLMFYEVVIPKKLINLVNNFIKDYFPPFEIPKISNEAT